MDTDNKYGTLDIQKELLLLLKEFDSFCVKEGIKYSLDSGSLLGAIRHKGFIPWDDDLDVILDRENYNKLIFTVDKAKSLVIERITGQALWVDRVRLQGAEAINGLAPTLDIFILDNVPDNKWKAVFKKYTIFMLQGMLKPHLSMKKGSLIMKLCSLISYMMGLFFPRKVKYKWYNMVSQWGNKDKCKYGSCYNYTFKGIGKLFPSDALKRIIRVPFESIDVSVMEDYDSVLTSIYGDYMTPPKEKERIPKHMK